ncbi:helix-turn-helix domain-containing protein [Fredinandcohnia humi]
MLGERIRTIRKQKKLTLEELAGSELTKGMLSLIENNKANPSMESLAYIAERLEVEISELLGQVSVYELRDVLEEAEKLFNKDTDKYPNKYKELIALIKPYASKLHQGYEAARLLDIYGRSLYWENNDTWSQHCDLAARLYDQMNITAKRAGIGFFRAIVKFVEHDYEQALKILLNERKEIEAKHAYIDSITRLDFDYQEASLHFAVGDTVSAKRVMDAAISYSKTNKTFYLIDDLYRLAAAYAMMAGDKESHEYYLEKLRQYAEFADDQLSKLIYQLFYIELLNTVKKEYQVALDHSEKYLKDPDFNEPIRHWFYLEKGKALHGLTRFKEAISIFDKIQIPTYHHHPFDLSQFYLADTYKALCYVELGKITEAISAAKKAVMNFTSLPNSPYKEFSLKTYENIVNQVK